MNESTSKTATVDGCRFVGRRQGGATSVLELPVGYQQAGYNLVMIYMKSEWLIEDFVRSCAVLVEMASQRSAIIWRSMAISSAHFQPCSPNGPSYQTMLYAPLQ